MSSTSHEHRKKKRVWFSHWRGKPRITPGSNVPVSLNSDLLWYRKQNYFGYTSLSSKNSLCGENFKGSCYLPRNGRIHEQDERKSLVGIPLSGPNWMFSNLQNNKQKNNVVRDVKVVVFKSILTKLNSTQCLLPSNLPKLHTSEEC